MPHMGLYGMIMINASIVMIIPKEDPSMSTSINSLAMKVEFYHMMSILNIMSPFKMVAQILP